MGTEKKSYELVIEIPDGIGRAQMMDVVERGAAEAGLYISHIGGYSRVKYPNSVHWHFKRDRNEPGLIDATFWEEGQAFWLVLRRSEPPWVHETAPMLRAALEAALAGHLDHGSGGCLKVQGRAPHGL
ncbi:MAG: hypothetical protein AAGG06_20170 [Pseudomonadota bacterium]